MKTIKLLKQLFTVSLSAVLIILFESCSSNINNNKLEIFTDEYPRAYFFRRSESMAASGEYSYKEWDSIFSRLSGIEGKVLDEEVPGLSKYNIEYFTRFKENHPEQIVLLHYNGNACDPRIAQHYFAGHWIYYEGCQTLENITATEETTTVKVKDPRLFRTGIGRYKNSNEDLGICELDESGKPNWHLSEQVQLVHVDSIKNTITIKRGCYGTKPRAFISGKTWIAAHVFEGPFGPEEREPHLLWYYNHSTACPRDSNGRQCNDILAEEVSKKFMTGGILESFDGVQFDVLMSEVSASTPLGNRGADTDADGKADNGNISGINEYSIGVIEFCKLLRKQFPVDKLLLADSFKKGHQRAFSLLNGVESEGWPSLSDPNMNDWSGGINRMLFWKQNSFEPSFIYINHKWGERFKKDVNFNNNRVVLAAAQCMGLAFCNSNAPEPEQDEIHGIWDELVKGRDRVKKWLGNPLSETRRLALESPDLLKGTGVNIGAALLKRIVPFGNAQTIAEDGKFKIFSTFKKDRIKFSIKNVITEGPDLFVSFKIRGSALENYPEEVGRELMSGIQVDDKSPANMKFTSWFNQEDYQVGIYFRDVSSREVDLVFEVEGNEPVWISDLTIHSFPDVMVREFENGSVLINPSLHSHSFDLASLFPNVSFRRLNASSQQDVAFNNGKVEKGILTLNAIDAIFLIKEP